jgi:hypothetical protein
MKISLSEAEKIIMYYPTKKSFIDKNLVFCDRKKSITGSGDNSIRLAMYYERCENIVLSKGRFFDVRNVGICGHCGEPIYSFKSAIARFLHGKGYYDTTVGSNKSLMCKKCWTSLLVDEDMEGAEYLDDEVKSHD